MERAMQTAGGAKSFEELKDRFLRYYRNGKYDAMMALYYQVGASSRMRKLYRDALPKRYKEQITQAQVGDFSGQYWPDRDPFTLKPEKLLLVKFGSTKQQKQQGLVALERWFFLGRHEGRCYLTMPTGKNRPRLKANAATFAGLVKELAQILAVDIPRQLENKKWRLKNKEWKSVSIEERWSANGNMSISKIGVVLANGRIFSRLDAPQPVYEIMRDIGKIKDKAFAQKWYGIKIVVQPDQTHRIEYNSDPDCTSDPTFFDPD
jgi:hypothetical protein